jgi:hypothetical protein
MLLIALGPPLEIISELVKNKSKTTIVMQNSLPGKDLKKILKEFNIELVGHDTLLDSSKFKFGVRNFLPYHFNEYRRTTRDIKIDKMCDRPRKGQIRKTSNMTDKIIELQTYMPDLEKDLKYSSEELELLKAQQSTIPIKGGED